MTRQAEIQRKTAETDISLALSLDGGEVNISTGIGFLDHMLTLFARHGGFGLTLRCDGDVQVDDHHSAEDIGICLGQAFDRALGDRRGIARYGSMLLPMDEALILCALDISGRSMLCTELGELPPKVGSFDTELVEEFLLAFTRHFPITLHLRRLAGSNTHHIIEGCFKALARALGQAVTVVGNEIPSTKGVL
ncbi:MAG: imidazoleglycerol-phosphate dehydratase HisB [Ruminococcaceae bacterium]|nr:imidazoleglycerol-phosphate dehydratase HisB [Oscillospiraceae bacterium]